MNFRPTPTIVLPEPPRVPAWAVPQRPVTDPAEAAFCAGAALNVLDLLVRSEPVWAGAWRARLALKCAAAAVRLAGRTEDEAALRDAVLFLQPGGDPGPAGHHLRAWQYLATRTPALDPGDLQMIVARLGLRWSPDLVSVPKWIADLDRARRPPPFAAAALAGQVTQLRPDAEILAFWLADLVLARRLRWPFSVPVSMAQVQSAAFRPDADKTRIKPGGPEFATALCLAFIFGAAEACAVANGIAANAARLREVAPKLRAKGAGEVVTMLLNEDAVSGTLRTEQLTRWGSRRLFERLIDLKAVQELTGRSSFKLYGL
jgi:hypothetical protein